MSDGWVVDQLGRDVSLPGPVLGHPTVHTRGHLGHFGVQLRPVAQRTEFFGRSGPFTSAQCEVGHARNRFTGLLKKPGFDASLLKDRPSSRQTEVC